MKKLVLSLALLVGCFAAKAQTVSSETVTLNVKLNPLQTITIGQKNVDLEFTTLEQYQGTVSKEILNDLTVTSIGAGFKLYAQSDISNFNKTETALSGDYVSLSIKEAGDKKDYVTKSLKQIDKTNTSKEAYFTKDYSIVNKTFDVKYSATLPKDVELSKLIGKEKAVYTATIVYSIEVN